MVCCLNPECKKPLNQDNHKFCESCGFELIPLLRNRFKIIKPLGQGGFGKTYLAEDTDKLGETCVVKQLIYHANGTQANKLVVSLFMREAKQLQQLWANPQIPSLFAYFEEGSYLYLVQQYVEGQDLLHELEAQGCFNDQRIQSLLLDLIPIFEAIHNCQVIHRDIKPENIMRRSSDGKLVLIDFGVSKQLSKSLVSVAGTVVGSLGYAAPEQMESGNVYPSSDLYSLGATCFHLLTNINPWHLWKKQGYGWLEQWQQHLKQPISPELGFVLNKMLQFDLKDRYQAATEVLFDLHDQVNKSSQTSTSPVQVRSTTEIVSKTTPLPQSPSKHRGKLEHLKKSTAESQKSKSPKPANAASSIFFPPSKTFAIPLMKTRRQFLTWVGFGGIGLSGAIIWYLIEKSSITSVRTPVITLPKGDQLGRIEFETVKVNSNARVIERLEKKVRFFVESLSSSINLEMIAIPAGKFMMGTIKSKYGSKLPDEYPQREVTLSKFYMGRFEVTQAQWQAIMGFNHSDFKGDNRPVEDVSWEDAVEFCMKLSKKSGKDYRLPTEAEWEYACRAGTTHYFNFGESISSKLANYAGTATIAESPTGRYRGKTTEVGIFPPNAFGLYDMHGNVWEWCQDTWHENYIGAPTDGSARYDKQKSSDRVRRGGSWASPPGNCRSAYRLNNNKASSYNKSTIGFRVVCTTLSFT